jgi:hypothetical protein
MTTLGTVLILNATMTLVNLTVLLINSSHIIKEIKKVR